MLESGLDPTVINGGIINSLKSTTQLGKGEWSVIESDESDGSFLNLPITYSIVTNIDKEHLDYYGDFKKLKKSFCDFVEKTPSFSLQPKSWAGGFPSSASKESLQIICNRLQSLI